MTNIKLWWKHWKPHVLIVQYGKVRQKSIMKTACSSLSLSSPQSQSATKPGHWLCRNWIDSSTCQATGWFFIEVNKCLWSFKPLLKLHYRQLCRCSNTNAAWPPHKCSNSYWFHVLLLLIHFKIQNIPLVKPIEIPPSSHVFKNEVSEAHLHKTVSEMPKASLQ